MEWNIFKNSVETHCEKENSKVLRRKAKVSVYGIFQTKGRTSYGRFQTLNLSEERTMFRIKTLMIPAKLKMQNDPKFAGQLWNFDQYQRMDSRR